MDHISHRPDGYEGQGDSHLPKLVRRLRRVLAETQSRFAYNTLRLTSKALGDTDQCFRLLGEDGFVSNLCRPPFNSRSGVARNTIAHGNLCRSRRKPLSLCGSHRQRRWISIYLTALPHLFNARIGFDDKREFVVVYSL